MTAHPANSPIAPYVGLRPFEFHEAALFYGRGEHIAEMSRTLRKGHFLAVVGSSGSGKSSLVRAGLLPAIAGGFMDDGDDEPDWRFVIMRPGLDPYENLLGELLPKLAPDQVLDPTLVDFRRRTLRGGPRGMVEIVADSLLPEATRLVVLVDQFEEIFRFLERGRPNQPGDMKASAEQRNAALAFVDMLLATAAERDRRVYVVLTMRSEYLGECEAFLGLSAAIAKAQFLTPRMTREQLQDVVERPIKAFGGTIEPTVVAAILNSLGTAQDQLPCVEHVLLRMWNYEAAEKDGQPPSLRMEDYRAVGRFEAALDQHAEQHYQELGSGTVGGPPSEEQRVAEQLFRALAARTSHGTLVRRLSSIGEVAAIAGVSEQTVVAVVEHFRQPGTNFLVATPAGPLTGKTTLDISHESLLRQWVRLGKWVTAEADAGSELQRLARDAASWNEGKRGFLGQPELGLFQKLRKESFPSREWASRYVKPEEFDLADKYLQQSVNAQQKNDESRKQDRRKQELRRGGIVVLAILLFLVIPLAIYSNHLRLHAIKQRDDATMVSNKLSKAIEKEKLVDRIIRVVQIVRTLAELGASQSEAELDVALNRWEVLSKLIQLQESDLPLEDRYITKCLEIRFPKSQYPDGIASAIRPHKAKGDIKQEPVPSTADWVAALKIDALYVAHDLRNELLAQDAPEVKVVVEKELQYVRAISFQRVSLCVTDMLELFKGESFDDGAPYVREFWLNYYGDFGLTEGDLVAKAMIKFGDKLNEIEKQLPAFALADGLESYRQNIKDRNAKDMPASSMVPVIQHLIPSLKGIKIPNAKEINEKSHEANKHFRKYSRMVRQKDLDVLTSLGVDLKKALELESANSPPILPIGKGE